MKKLYLYAFAFILPLSLTPSARAADEHPTIAHAIASLEHTKQELEGGEHGFGGHRSKAIEHIDSALKELHEALQYAQDHPDEVKPAGK